jgi:hypothetical protein
MPPFGGSRQKSLLPESFCIEQQAVHIEDHGGDTAMSCCVHPSTQSRNGYNAGCYHSPNIPAEACVLRMVERRYFSTPFQAPPAAGAKRLPSHARRAEGLLSPTSGALRHLPAVRFCNRGSACQRLRAAPNERAWPRVRGHVRRGALRAAGTPRQQPVRPRRVDAGAWNFPGLADGNTKGLSSFSSGKEH